MSSSYGLKIPAWILYSNPLSTAFIGTCASVTANLLYKASQTSSGQELNRSALMILSIYNILTGTILAFFYQDSRAVISVDMATLKQRPLKSQRISNSALDS